MIHHIIILSILLLVQTYLFLYFYDSIETDEYNEIKKYGELVTIVIFTAITPFIYLKDKFELKNILIITAIYEIIIILFWVYLNYIYEPKHKANNGVLVGDNVISNDGILLNTNDTVINNSASTKPIMNLRTVSTTHDNPVPSNNFDTNNNNIIDNDTSNFDTNNEILYNDTSNFDTNNNNIIDNDTSNFDTNNNNIIDNDTSNFDTNNNNIIDKILTMFGYNKKKSSKIINNKKLKKSNKLENDNIFSKYINTNKNDFSFHPLYPKYIESNNNNDISTIKDYSAYNGYNENSICHQCKCIKNENDDIFCGKSVAGFGVIGCSEKWECNSCKDCQSWDDKDGEEEEKKVSNDTESKQYECKNCKCRDTIAGKVCGKRGRIDGQFIKCKPHCVNCGNCSGDTKRLDTGSYITYYPEKKINIENVIINNISKIDIDNIL